jgi:hypothetical protein
MDRFYGVLIILGVVALFAGATLLLINWLFWRTEKTDLYPCPTCGHRHMSVLHYGWLECDKCNQILIIKPCGK